MATLLAGWFLGQLGIAHANGSRQDTAQFCEAAAIRVSRESGVPLDVLRAITLTETGRRSDQGFQPWPWTVNMEGVGKWFKSLEEARSYVDRHFDRGARSFDVGCFQINYRWHHEGFASIDQMFEPLANARYAAKFLTELYAEFGSWSKAAGAYHSRTPKYARKYAARFDRIRARLPMASTPEPPPDILARVPQPPPALTPSQEIIARFNTYPLLQPGTPQTSGSLVPLTRRASARFIDIRSTIPLVENQ